MGKHDGEGGGGMRGSDADPAPPPVDHRVRKDVRISTTTNVDEAAHLRAQGFVNEQDAAAARHGLNSAVDALGKSFGWLEGTQVRLLAANATIADLQAENARLRTKSKKHKATKEKEKTKRHKIDQRASVLKHAVTQLAPGVLHLAPKVALLADRLLPSVLSAAANGDATPAAAATRLFVELNDPDPESVGAQTLETLRLLAGEQDWALIQQGLAELAASSPAARAAAAAPSYVAAASASNGAAHA
jgi:hypothetical protein